ncbi:predicted protein [Botrytis cinerea T4]|uniref:Uncharacterized protein n=1 Tax=Botryotinia fuckeliana (strain T4) TaxID=999810 RepID=G2YDU7_BOTF4|nr:predicted protein [Botrytis cinerea T4]
MHVAQKDIFHVKISQSQKVWGSDASRSLLDVGSHENLSTVSVGRHFVIEHKRRDCQRLFGGESEKSRHSEIPGARNLY